jgi:hypothetical protein
MRYKAGFGTQWGGKFFLGRALLPAVPSCRPHRPVWQIEVGPNPLNFSKPCVLASTSSPIESVLLGQGNVSQAIVAAQLDCTQRYDEPSCSKDLVGPTCSWGRGPRAI